MSKKRKFVKILCVLIFILLVKSENIFAQANGALYSAQSIFSLSDFNGDGMLDTLIGASFSGSNILPKWIFWGNTAGIRKQTTIVYPSWKSPTGDCNILRINSDTLSDLLISFRGDTSSDTNVKIYSDFTIALFGQHGLDTIPSVYLDSINAYQSSPAAMRINYNSDLSDPVMSELNGTVLYSLDSISLHLPALKAIKKAKTQSKANPKVYYDGSELNNMADGMYNIEILDSHNNVISKSSLVLQGANQIMEKLDCSKLTAGSYYLSVSTEKSSVGKYSFIVVE